MIAEVVFVVWATLAILMVATTWGRRALHQAFLDIGQVFGIRRRAPVNSLDARLNRLADRYVAGELGLEGLEKLAAFEVGLRPPKRDGPAWQSKAGLVLEKAEQWNRIQSTSTIPMSAAPVAYEPDPDSMVDLVDGTGRIIARLPTRHRPVLPIKPDPRLSHVKHV